ncbi:MAG: hypothetical protein ACYDAO_09985, partial [Thermoplasmataceae archaeon]
VKGSTYGINSQFSDIQFVYSNGTHIYAWIQDISGSTATIWLKLYSDVNQTINMEVYPQSVNLLNATGYLGEAPNINRAKDNGYSVFDTSGAFYENFNNLTDYNKYFSGGAINGNVSNGLKITNGISGGPDGNNVVTNILFNESNSILISNGYFAYKDASYGRIGLFYTPVTDTSWISGNFHYGLSYNNSAVIPFASSATNNNLSYTFQIWHINGVPSAIQEGNGVYYKVTATGVYSGIFPIAIQLNSGVAEINYTAIANVPHDVMPSVSIGSAQAVNLHQYYQQLISLTNPQSYGINSVSSNFYVALPNNTLLYTWIQSYNSTSLTMWVKMSYNTAQVELQVLPSFENVLSATGYLGEASWITTSDNNYKLVFSQYQTNLNINATGEIFPYFGSYNGNSNLTAMIFSISSITSFNYFDLYNGSFQPNIYNSSGFIYGKNAFTNEGDFNSTIPFNKLSYGVLYTDVNSAGTTVYFMLNGKVFYLNTTVIFSAGYLGIVGSLVANFNYLIGVPNLPNGVMPSVSIGSGSVFMANSTQFTKSFYSQVSNYAPDPLKQLYTYSIYDSFNANYITLFANSSWIFEGDTGYSLPYQNTLHELTFNGVSGIGQVQATFLEPSQQIGQPSFISLSLTASGQAIYQGFSVNVAYKTWHSDITQYINGTSSFFQLPFGSVANITILNDWGQVVKTLSNVIIDQTTFPIPISLTGLVSSVSFQFINTTASNVYISANGITQTESGYVSFYASNQTTYDYEASIFDPNIGSNVNYSGSFTTNAPNKIVYLNATAPLAEIQINANAYAGSQVGQLSSSGPDMVLMTINGIPSDLGASYVGFIGQSLAVRIYTVLNQTLYSGNILLNLPVLSDTINIQTPSWNFQLKNAEQVYNTTSPLATEIINLTYIGSSGNYSYHTSDMVGNILSIYLASGNYHVYLHDNATFATNFSVVNDTFFIIFGQHLLTESQFASTIGKLYGNSVGLIVVPVNAPSNLIQGQKTILQFQVFYSNHTIVGSNYLKAYLGNATISISNSTYTSLLFGSVVNGIISINLTAPPPSSYTIRIIGGFGFGGTTMGGSYSYPLVVQSSASDAGLHLYISGATTLQVNNSYTYYLQFEYSNGSALSSTASSSLLKNITITPAETISTISPGDYTITVKPISTGTLTILVSGYFMQSGYNLTASGFYPVEVVSQTTSLTVIPIDTPTSTSIGIQATYLFKLAFPNGTLLSSSQIDALINASTYTLENSQDIIPTITHSGEYIYINFTLPDTGYYTLTWTSEISKLGTTYTLIYSNSIQAIPSESGMILKNGSPTKIEQNTTVTFPFYVYYTTGIPMNLTDTRSIASNTTIYAYEDGNFIQLFHAYAVSAGEIAFKVKLPLGIYALKIQTTDTSIRNQMVYQSQTQSLTVVNYSVTTQTSLGQQLLNYFHTPDGIITLVLAIVPILAALVWRRLNRGRAEREASFDAVGNSAEGQLAVVNMTTEQKQAAWNAIPQERKDKLLALLTSGNYRSWKKFAKPKPKTRRFL